MAEDKGRSRRSFLGNLLTGAAGVWVALTSTSAVGAFLAACSRKQGGSAQRDDPVLQPVVTKYGGPVLQMDRPRLVKYGGPSMTPPAPGMDPPPAPKVGGPSAAPVSTPPLQPARKVRGPARRPKKYGGSQARKYGGPRTGGDLDKLLR
jgi:hypothetical protein